MTTEQASAQAYLADARNDQVLVYVNGAFAPRNEASVSVFDSGFVLGDGVWEGLRLVKGKLISLDAHLDRLFEGTRSIDLDIGLDRAGVTKVVTDTLAKNGMTDGAHIRLMITRGLKKTPNQDPRFVIGKATIVCVAEYKTPIPEAKAKGYSLFTSTFRTTNPDQFDLRLNSHSRLNLIQALIQAIKAGADEALMLDPLGFVATCNSTHFFIVRRGEVWTSSGQYCIPGITRSVVIRACRENGIPVFEKQFSLYDVYGADEAFVTGTFAGLVPVREIDGRTVAHPLAPKGDWPGIGPMTERLTGLYKALAKREAKRAL